jgi:hypothetical protein
MKGIVLVLFSLLIAPVSSSFCAPSDTDFGFGANFSSTTDPAAVLRAPVRTSSPTAQLITDTQAEQRNSRPIVAYTLFRFDSRFAEVSVQPVVGRINGAQVRLNF